MGGNKLFLSLDGVPLFQIVAEKLARIFDEIIVCLAESEFDFFTKIFAPLLENLPLKICRDRHEGLGPIEGLACGLAAMSNEWGFLFACDMPTPNIEVIKRIWSAKDNRTDVIAPRLDGHVNAIHAFYKKSCYGHIENHIKNAKLTKNAQPPFNLRIKVFFDDVKVKIIEERSLEFIPGYRSSFEGFNTEEELRRKGDCCL